MGFFPLSCLTYGISDGNTTLEWYKYFRQVSGFTLLSRATKITLYKTIIRPVLSYGAEAWTLAKKALQIFERKIFRRINVLNMKIGNGKLGRIEN